MVITRYFNENVKEISIDMLTKTVGFYTSTILYILGVILIIKGKNRGFILVTRTQEKYNN
jgi:hypothetical protein